MSGLGFDYLHKGNLTGGWAVRWRIIIRLSVTRVWQDSVPKVCPFVRTMPSDFAARLDDDR